MELSKTAYVILGMLSQGPRCGYEIKTLMDGSTRFFWASSYGQIYPELRSLEQAGLIAGEDDPSDGRRRRVFSLTPAGEQALRDWLESDEPLHLELRHEGALKLFFSDAIGPEGSLEQVRRIRDAHEGIREQLRAIRASKSPEGYGDSCRLTLEWGLAYQDFLIDWCSRMERRLAAETANSRG